MSLLVLLLVIALILALISCFWRYAGADSPHSFSLLGLAVVLVILTLLLPRLH